MIVRHVSLIAVFLVVGCSAPERIVAPPGQPVAAITPAPAEPVREAPPQANQDVSKDEFWSGLPTGIVDGRSHFPATDVTEWTLANGARVVLRSSRSEPRRVYLVAYALSGLAEVDDVRAVSAVIAAHASRAGMNRGGVRVGSSLMGDLAVVVGDASTESLGELLERATEHMTRLEWAGMNPTLDPQDALSLLLSGHPETALGATFNPGEAAAFYEARFGDPRQFTYILVGDVLPGEVERQAANILTSARPSMQAVLGASERIRPAPALDRAAVWTMPEYGQRASFHLGFRTSIRASYDNLAGLEILAELLKQRLETTTGRDIDVAVTMDFDHDFAELRTTSNGPGTDGEGFRSMVFDAVRMLRANEPTTRLLVSARAAVRAEHEQAIQTNAGWLKWLVRLFRYDHDTREALRFGQRIRGVSAIRVHDLARSILAPDRYALVIQRSE